MFYGKICRHMERGNLQFFQQCRVRPSATASYFLVNETTVNVGSRNRVEP